MNSTDPHSLLPKLAAWNAIQNTPSVKLQNYLRLLWLKTRRRLGKLQPPPLFDSNYYLQHAPDVAQTNTDPYVHYLMWGWQEGRNPSDQFDVGWYLQSNPDVLAAGLEPLTHYTQHGIHEDRLPLPPADILPYHTGRVPEHELRLCIGIPASPNDEFFSQVAMLRLALDKLGGVYQKADIVLFLGDEHIKALPSRWEPYLSDKVIIEWADPDDFRKYNAFAQANARWGYDYSDYDVVGFLDADVLVVKPIDDLLISMVQSPSVMGAIAHYTLPRHMYDDPNPKVAWQKLSQQFTGKPIAFNYRHTLSEHQPNEWLYCPFYINYGMVLFTPHMIHTLRDTYLSLQMRLAAELEYPFFSAQIALTLTFNALDMRMTPISLKYNYPNDPTADRLHTNELRDVRIIHYLRTDKFDRQRIFTNQEEFDRFLSLELTGSDRVFQTYVRQLTAGTYPFGGMA